MQWPQEKGAKNKQWSSKYRKLEHSATWTPLTKDNGNDRSNFEDILNTIHVNVMVKDGGVWLFLDWYAIKNSI